MRFEKKINEERFHNSTNKTNKRECYDDAIT